MPSITVLEGRFKSQAKSLGPVRSKKRARKLVVASPTLSLPRSSRMAVIVGLNQRKCVSQPQLLGRQVGERMGTR